jgi:hypothetical protein
MAFRIRPCAQSFPPSWRTVVLHAVPLAEFLLHAPPLGQVEGEGDRLVGGLLQGVRSPYSSQLREKPSPFVACKCVSVSIPL